MKWCRLAWAAVKKLLLTGSSQPLSEDTEYIDGGQTHYVNKNAPKVVESEEITCFFCEFSTTDIPMNESPVAGRYYTLSATENEGSFEARAGGNVYEKRSFLPDAAFFAQLQQIVATYNLAQYNGEFYTVAGLPPDLGAKLSIRYASSEQICARNNQSSFLPLEAMEALISLFCPKDIQYLERE